MENIKNHTAYSKSMLRASNRVIKLESKGMKLKRLFVYNDCTYLCIAQRTYNNSKWIKLDFKNENKQIHKYIINDQLNLPKDDF